MSARDAERLERLQGALRERRWDGLVCTLPANVLLLSGYWPVIGNAVALVTRDGQVGVLAPEDERDLAEGGWADPVVAFQPGSLRDLRRSAELVAAPLGRLAGDLGLGPGSTIGFEDRAEMEPATYVALHVYGAELPRLLDGALPGRVLVPAGEPLARLRAVLTPREVGRVRAACAVAEGAFRHGAGALRAGLAETEAAAIFRAPLSAQLPDGAGRADGFLFCMSGEDGARAAAAYQRSRQRRLLPGDLALVHCNSYLDGYWTDITRTFSIGGPDELQRHMYEAVLEARRAAFGEVRPGARAADVDRAARDVLHQRGFGAAFRHATGHGVGFAAIDHEARPRIHPASDEVLESGMTFNIEPAIYLDGRAGLRHCDVVTVTEAGMEVLTPWLATPAELTRCT